MTLVLPWGSARPITVAQHLEAKERIEAASQQFIMIDWGRGPEKFFTGFIHMDDYTHRDGYVVRLQGFDRFGWPEGHAMSPARLHE